MLSIFSTNLHTYYFIRSDRVYGRGGGVGIMIHNDFRIISSTFLVFSYSDGLSITLKSSNDIIFKIIVIYRPPNNDFTTFFNEFSDLVINSNIYNTIFIGDFNFHYGSLKLPHLEFKSLINSLSLKQHVLCKTHYLGNTLDLFLTNSDSDIIYGIAIISKLLTDLFINITFRLKLFDIKIKRAFINYRNIKTLNINDFSNDIINSLSN